MILTGREQCVVGAVTESEKGCFLSLERFLDDHTLTCRTERQFHHHVFKSFNGFLFGLGHDNALARGEAVGLDHDGSALSFTKATAESNSSNTRKGAVGTPASAMTFLEKALEPSRLAE